jgi:hypothetical protein
MREAPLMAAPRLLLSWIVLANAFGNRADAIADQR